MAVYNTLEELFTGIAAAIRKKESSTAMIVADDFPSRIEQIANHDIEDALSTGAEMEIYRNERITSIGDYCLSGIGARIVVLDKTTVIGEYALRRCARLEKVIAPMLDTVGEEALAICRPLSVFDMRGMNGKIAADAFRDSISFVALVIRTTIGPCKLLGSFHNTTVANGKTYIYVPRVLVDDYKTAENWSTYASQFRALEDYTVDGTITGELDESKI